MGEAILVLFALALVGYLLVAPIVAFAFAVRATRRSDDLLARVRELEGRVADLTAELRRGELPAAGRAARRALAPLPAAAVTDAAAAAPAEAAAATAAVAIAVTDAAAAVTDAAAVADADAVAVAVTDAAAATATDAVAPAAAAPDAAPVSPAAPVAPEPQASTPSEPPSERRPSMGRPSFEEQLGLTWLTRAGAAAFLLGALFFFKYAVDNEWIGPTGRVAIGGAVGALLLVAAEAIRTKTRRRFVHALLGIGLATLFVSVWASAAFYRIAPTALAFAANTALLLLGAALAFRHRAEVVLILALVAGFLNPVVLSTGEDRPFELFAYLLLVTSVTHGVSARLGFRVAPWLGIAGTAALFGGWYGKFFDATDRRAMAWADEPSEALVGPYLALSARAVPLVFVGLFALQWSGLALWLRRRAADAVEAAPAAYVKAIAVAALVLAHAGASVLLFDAPRTLAIGAIALAGASIALLRAVSASDWLVVPMGAAFVAFLAVSGATPVGERALLVAMLGVWTLVYLAGFVRSAGVDRDVPQRAALGAAAGTALFACLAGVLLLGPRPALFAAALAACAVVVAFLSSRSGLRGLSVGAAAAAAAALSAAAPGALGHAAGRALDPVFLGAVGLWALVHLAAVAEDVLRRRAPIGWPAVLAASVATLGFLATALLSTSDEAPTLRALLTAAAGVADLALGALLLRAPGAAAAGDRIALLLGQALALFAAAIAFGLSGATVTVLWGVLAVVAAAVAARSPRASGADRTWIAVSALLFGAALVRAVVVDVARTYAIVSTFFETRGRDGALSVPVLLNPRAYAFAGLGAALLAAARIASRAPAEEAAGGAGAPGPGRDALRAAASVAGVLGYGLLLALLVTEVRSALTALPAPPPLPLDAAEFAEFSSHYHAALFAQRGRIAMITTLVLALAAIALLTAGFAARDAFHRYLGLALFVVTVAKLAAWDVWRIERVYQITLLTGVGALLVGGGFLYARFGQRLVALMRKGAPTSARVPPGALGVLLAFAALGAGARPAAAQAAPPLRVGRFALVRPVEGVAAAGDHRVDVDFDLYRQSLAAELLADVRIAGPDGAEAPYVVREVGADGPSGAVPSTMYDPTVDDAGAARATFRIDAPEATHCRIDLDVVGPTFLRQARVETGDDGVYGEVARGAWVYRIRQGAETVERLDVAYPRSRAGLVRVTLLPEPPGAAAPRVRIRGGAVSCAAPAAEAPARALPLVITETRRDDAAQATIVTLDAGAEGVPVEAIHLDVGTDEFSRRVDVAATTFREVWPSAGSGVVHRIRPRPGLELAQTRVALTTTRKRWIRLTIHDGDAAPLALTGARAEVRAREIVLRAAQPGAHRLYVGDKLGDAPRYDLAAILGRAERDAPPAPAALGPASPNPKHGAEEVAPHLPFTERHRGAIGAALAALLLALSLWAVRLLRKADAVRRPGAPNVDPNDAPPQA